MNGDDERQSQFSSISVQFLFYISSVSVLYQNTGNPPQGPIYAAPHRYTVGPYMQLNALRSTVMHYNACRNPAVGIPYLGIGIPTVYTVERIWCGIRWNVYGVVYGGTYMALSYTVERIWRCRIRWNVCNVVCAIPRKTACDSAQSYCIWALTRHERRQPPNKNKNCNPL